jgi:hypothetical protein
LSSRASQVLASVYLAAAETIVITVGGNSTDGTTTFDRQRVVAVLGDTVVFNCKFFFLSCRRDLIDIPVTSGNHTATQSTFSNPCIPAHDTDVTINGFDSGFRNTTPGTAGSIMSVPILQQNQNQTFWFFDFNPCGQGGVGVINDNESSTETLVGFVVRDFASCRIDSATLRRFGVSHTHISYFEDKHSFWSAFFQRNAVRLNGTNSSDANSGTSTSSGRPSSVTSSSSVPKSSSAAERAFAIGTVGVIPLFIASLFV